MRTLVRREYQTGLYSTLAFYLAWVIDISWVIVVLTLLLSVQYGMQGLQASPAWCHLAVTQRIVVAAAQRLLLLPCMYMSGPAVLLPLPLPILPRSAPLSSFAGCSFQVLAVGGHSSPDVGMRM